MLHVVLDLYPLSYPTHGPGAQQEPSLGYDRRGSLQWLPARVMFILSRWHTQRRCGRWRPAAKTPACTSTARHVPPTSLSSSNCSARTSPSTILRDRPGHPLLSGAPTSAISPDFRLPQLNFSRDGNAGGSRRSRRSWRRCERVSPAVVRASLSPTVALLLLLVVGLLSDRMVMFCYGATGCCPAHATC
jgi:hypothetical protein